MTVPEPTGDADVERPLDVTDPPGHRKPGPAPTPEFHPDDGGLPGDETGTPGPDRHVPGT